MTGMHLAGKNLAGAKLSGVDLTNAVLTGARLNGADLRGADLRGATLDGAQIVDVAPTAWKGVKANWHTCWPTGFDFGDPRLGLVATPLKDSTVATVGQYCDERKDPEGDASAPH
jgi:uncharacterized protein YjbI with pentapeptide repeats